jgi:hypothetical protein
MNKKIKQVGLTVMLVFFHIIALPDIVVAIDQYMIIDPSLLV